jgi:hypothetical protein
MTTAMKNNVVVTQKIKNRITVLLGIYPEELKEGS